MTVTTTAPPHRPWEVRSEQQTPQPPAPSDAKLPPISSLTASMSDGGAVPPELPPVNNPNLAAERDSGSWSMTQSARSSAYSSVTNGTNSIHHAPPFGSASYPSPARMSTVSDGPQQNGDFYPISPTSSASQQPPVNFSQAPSMTVPSFHRNLDEQRQDQSESRRSSIDSRMNHGIGSLALNQTSPYHSTNASQSSIVSTMQRDRDMSGGYISHVNGHRGPRFPPSSPLGRRGRRSFPPGRTAPAISSNPRSEIYNAEAPTAGMAYAFPDPGAPAAHGSRTNELARRESRADSIASSMFTLDSVHESRLPQGQHELPQGVHHHSLQHKQVRNLIGESEMSNGPTPYSRTPELRITHKLAERKRRSEMKDLFDMLRGRLPVNHNAKTSKWETLHRAIDYINDLENSKKQYEKELDLLRAELEAVSQLHRQGQGYQQHQHQHQQQRQPQQSMAPPNFEQRYPPPQSPFAAHFSQSASATPPQANVDPLRTLPPLVNGTSAMQDVQYTHDKR